MGWRILAGCDLAAKELKSVLISTHEGTEIKSLLTEDFVRKHSQVLEILREEEPSEEQRNLLENFLDEESESVFKHFFPPEEDEPPEQDHLVPSILLSSFEGCKGLSAGHVFIVGLNHGIMPKTTPESAIPDIEYSKFIVAMTRTRKELHLLSNRWHTSYKDGPRLYSSIFVQMIPSELRRDGGYLKVKQMDAFLNKT